MAADLNIPDAPAIPGAEHLHSGKVRDLYLLGSGDLLMVASDRISAFDFVLDPGIPDKGEILTRMSLWWFDQLAGLVPHHVLSTDVPAEVAGRAVVCRRLDMFPVECVARGYLTGSGLLDYGATPDGAGHVGGHDVAGHQVGQLLEPPQRHPGQDLALVGDRGVEHEVEDGDPVAGHHEQLAGVRSGLQLVEVADLAGVQVPRTADRGCGREDDLGHAPSLCRMFI